MGYFQVKIAEEDQDLTCFITPWGRYKFKRAPMGLVSSGDEYNRRGDQVLGDIPRTMKGSSHFAPDALSRSPVEDCADGESGSDNEVDTQDPLHTVVSAALTLSVRMAPVWHPSRTKRWKRFELRLRKIWNIRP
ncbi:hypothetical protein Pcinc_043598 [Petrolisthes cinctipes]|uniref:Uncharacterized protein n=1 Tax=Petrolisthes cinctipes TaxID=88211 RepID=A0AAE1EF16_PETCI|nr:hypothetical protein Pcinc_043598 [Petrolisthes cinctipes]